MDAKELWPMADALDDWARSEDSAGNNSTAESMKAAAFAIRSYASLLASVESSGEEIVRMCDAASRDDRLADGMLYRRAAARIVSDAQEKERLRAEKEKAEEDLIVVASQRDYAMKSNALNYERAEKAEAELASVREHAEAMAVHLDNGIQVDVDPEDGTQSPRSEWDFVANELVAAYRAARAKEGA